MRQSKICIVGRSERDIENTTIPTHYTIRKYQEAMASGCLIAGDIPDNEVRYGTKLMFLCQMG